MGQNTPDSSCRVTQGRPDRFFKGDCRFLLHTRCFGGQKTGPNPTDRRKTGSKHHLITDANGIPLAHKLTGANRHDVTQALPLVNAIPAIGGKPGRPKKPNMVVMTIKIDEALAELVRSRPEKYSVTIEKALKVFFREKKQRVIEQP